MLQFNQVLLNDLGCEFNRKQYLILEKQYDGLEVTYN